MTESLWLAEVTPAKPVKLRPNSTIGDVIQSAIADGLNQLLRFGPGAYGGTDPEDIHKSRVATRKMRSQLKSFSVAIDGTWLRDVRSDLGWMADGLGAVRDADVMMMRIRMRASGLSGEDSAGAGTLIARLERVREESAENLRKMMEDNRSRSLVTRLQASAADPPVLPVASERAAELAPQLVSASWSRLARSVSDLPHQPADDDLHEVRIRAKRCRYTTEILQPVMGDDARRLVRVLAELQGVLGDIHDSHSTQEWLRASAGSTAEALVAGMMIAAEESDYSALIGSWRHVWRKALKVKVPSLPNR
ncbi:MAG TPA: CHAD domain-containing protein [Acidimicrobiales bacterium]|nr:CHAD domain-containing protein [Acidimicrobiales bacterium]